MGAEGGGRERDHQLWNWSCLLQTFLLGACIVPLLMVPTPVLRQRPSSLPKFFNECCEMLAIISQTLAVLSKS